MVCLTVTPFAVCVCARARARACACACTHSFFAFKKTTGACALYNEDKLCYYDGTLPDFTTYKLLSSASASVLRMSVRAHKKLENLVNLFIADYGQSYSIRIERAWKAPFNVQNGIKMPPPTLHNEGRALQITVETKTGVIQNSMLGKLAALAQQVDAVQRALGCYVRLCTPCVHVCVDGCRGDAYACLATPTALHCTALTAER